MSRFFNPLDYIYKGCDIANATKSLYICERKNRCKCKTSQECICDSDKYFQVGKIYIQEQSNNMLFFRITFIDQILLGKQKNLRFFQFEEGDTEKPLIDIIRVSKKHKIYETNLRFPCLEKKVEFPVDEDVFIDIKTNEINFAINYMMYIG